MYRFDVLKLILKGVECNKKCFMKYSLRHRKRKISLAGVFRPCQASPEEVLKEFRPWYIAFRA